MKLSLAFAHLATHLLATKHERNAHFMKSMPVSLQIFPTSIPPLRETREVLLKANMTAALRARPRAERSVIVAEQSIAHARNFVRLCFVMLLGMNAFVAQTICAQAQEWHEHYRNAQEAVAASDWKHAEREIRQALTLRKQSGLNVETSGLRFVDYLPYY